MKIFILFLLIFVNFSIFSKEYNLKFDFDKGLVANSLKKGFKSKIEIFNYNKSKYIYWASIESSDFYEIYIIRNSYNQVYYYRDMEQAIDKFLNGVFKTGVSYINVELTPVVYVKNLWILSFFNKSHRISLYL